jgi:hypothetical protein
MSPARPIAMVPYYGGTGAHWHYESLRKANLPAVTSIGGLSSIDGARALLLEQAMSSSHHFDVFVFIDSDVEFRRADFDALVESAHDEQAIVGGTYLTRMGLSGEQRLVSSPDVHEDMVISFFEAGGLYPATALGMGFTAIPRSAVERMVRHHQMDKCFFSLFGSRCPAYPLFMPLIHEGVYRFEDHAFCVRASEAGVSLFADTRPSLVHHGEHGYRVEDLRVRSQHDPSFRLEIGKVVAPQEKPVE